MKVGDTVKLKPAMWQGIKPESYGLSFTGEYVVSTVYDDQEYPSLRVEGIAGTFDVEAFQLVKEKGMKQFKVGDKFRVTKLPEYSEDTTINKVYVVQGVDTDGDVYFMDDSYSKNYALHENSFADYGVVWLEDNTVDLSKDHNIERPVLEERKTGKIRMELFDEGFPNAILEVAKVMTWASENKGYKDHDWVNLPDADSAFSAAASRHKLKGIIQKLNGVEVLQRTDEESNILHKAHEVFNGLAELELMLRGVIK